MMPVSFPESNAVFNPPEGVSEDEVYPVYAFKGQDSTGYPTVITCWQLSKEDLEEIQQTGVVWLGFMGGLPPHYATVENPFVSNDNR